MLLWPSSTVVGARHDAMERKEQMAACYVKTATMQVTGRSWHVASFSLFGLNSIGSDPAGRGCRRRRLSCTWRRRNKGSQLGVEGIRKSNQRNSWSVPVQRIAAAGRRSTRGNVWREESRLVRCRYRQSTAIGGKRSKRCSRGIYGRLDRPGTWRVVRRICSYMRRLGRVRQ